MTSENGVWKELERDWRSPEEVAGLLGVDASTVYRWLHSGVLGGLQLGKKWQISPSDMKEFLRRERERQIRKEPFECPLCHRPAECPRCGTDTYV